MSAFTGMRKVTIRDTSTGNTGTFSVFNPSKIGTDGMTIPLETNETTTSSMAGDVVEPNGTNVGAATLQLIPVDKSDLAAVWPQGYDAETGTWQPPIGECIVEDVTIAFEKICDTKENVILRHAKIALSFELALTRDETFMPEVTFYPQPSLGSEYGLSGDFADKLIPYQLYDGVYDPSTDAVTFDAVES